MGSFEKLVVLTVIFLASVVLVVSFQTPADEANARGEFVALHDDANRASAPGTGAAGTGTVDPAPTADDDAASTERGTDPGANPFAAGDRTPRVEGPGERGGSDPDGLFSASGADLRAPAAGAATPNVAPATTTETGGGYPALRDGVTGLTVHPGGLHVYRVGAADRSWTALSERFYGSGTWSDLLRRENAAVGPPVPGQEILVPSSAMRVALHDRTEAFEPRVPGRPAPRDPKAGSVPTEPETFTGDTYRTHVVASGETLTGIAFAYYGRASLWTRIFDANRDVLPDENDLTIGMELRIP